MRRKVLHRGVSRKNPSILVLGKGLRVIEVHLDEVFVEAVRATGPATLIVGELAGDGIYRRPHQTGERLGDAGGFEQVLLGPLHEPRVLVVPRKIAQTSPLEN